MGRAVLRLEGLVEQPNQALRCPYYTRHKRGRSVLHPCIRLPIIPEPALITSLLREALAIVKELAEVGS